MNGRGMFNVAAGGLLLLLFKIGRPLRFLYVLRQPRRSWMSREAAFLVNNWILLFCAFFVLFGTMFPTLSEAVTGERLTVGPPFFNKWMLPIGLVLLVGLVTKNSILLVEFANQRQAEGISAREAIIQAGRRRLRPIVMTALAAVAARLHDLNNDLTAVNFQIDECEARVAATTAGQHETEKAIVGHEAQATRAEDELLRVSRRLEVVLTEQRRAEQQSHRCPPGRRCCRPFRIVHAGHLISSTDALRRQARLPQSWKALHGIEPQCRKMVK